MRLVNIIVIALLISHLYCKRIQEDDESGYRDQQYKINAIAAVMKGILDANDVQNNNSNKLSSCFGSHTVEVFDFLDEGLQDPFEIFADLDKALGRINGFMGLLHNCIFSTQEGQGLYKAYNLKEGILLEEVRDQVIAYIALNPFDTNNSFDQAEEQWLQQQYESVGHTFAQFGHEIVDGSDLQVQEDEEEQTALVQQKKANKAYNSKSKAI